MPYAFQMVTEIIISLLFITFLFSGVFMTFITPHDTGGGF